ncbi:MAG: nhaA, partial [Magnetococcales bacterium]|nr:nhaA [Magnetococcales bacterium]
AGIVIIALFYSADLSMSAFLLAGLGVIVLVALNVRNVTHIAAYVLVGLFVWLCVLKSGVHATLAGVVVAMAIPLKVKGENGISPLHQLEHDLHPVVAFGILPVFAFTNAGVSLEGLKPADLMGSVPLGIALGLFLGKPIGIFGSVWLAVKMGMARLPEGMTWGRLHGVSLLCGVGFTMSLFIGSLAFEHAGGSDSAAFVTYRLGILSGSLCSALAGYFMLAYPVACQNHPAGWTHSPL